MKELHDLESEIDVLNNIADIINSDEHIVVAFDTANGNLIVSKTIPTEDAVLYINRALWHTDDPDVRETQPTFI